MVSDHVPSPAFVGGEGEGQVTRERVEHRAQVARSRVDVLLGLCGSLTPIIAEVAGISCISPRAPLEETAAWSKPDSTKMTALISDSGRR